MQSMSQSDFKAVMISGVYFSNFFGGHEMHIIIPGNE